MEKESFLLLAEKRHRGIKAYMDGDKESLIDYILQKSSFAPKAEDVAEELVPQINDILCANGLDGKFEVHIKEIGSKRYALVSHRIALKANTLIEECGTDEDAAHSFMETHAQDFFASIVLPLVKKHSSPVRSCTVSYDIQQQRKYMIVLSVQYSADIQNLLSDETILKSIANEIKKIIGLTQKGISIFF